MTTNKQKVVVGAGIAAAAAAVAAGAYWLYGAKDAAKHRKQVKSWMLKARAEVMDAVEKLDDIDKEKYLAIVQKVMERYATTAGVTGAQLAAVTRDLKSAWQHMEAVRRPAVKKAVKKAKRKKASRS